MTTRVLVVGTGVLADTVSGLLKRNRVIRATQIPAQVVTNFDLAMVLEDGWQPSLHTEAEDAFRAGRLPWLRGFVAFGVGIIGPLVLPGRAGCSACADLRMLMAENDRGEMFQIRMQLAVGNGRGPDVGSTRTGIMHMAHLLVAEVDRIVNDMNTCRVLDHILCTAFKTLETTRHFILPDASCPVCGNLPEDSAESVVIELAPNPKPNEHSFRSKSIRYIEQTLVHDYLDYSTGLLNGKVHDLTAPFAAVSVNLPLMMGNEGTAGRTLSYKECESVAILEGLERFCGLEPRGKRPVVHDSYANVKDHALNPLAVGVHHPDQYARPGFPFRPFHPDTEMDWVWGYSLIQARPLLVPKRLAYYSLGCHDGGFVYETSNGCAMGSTLVEAILHGILEVVERDGFLMTWYAQLRLPAIDLARRADRELRWMMERIQSVTGYDLHVYNATMENGIPTVFVIAKNRRGHGLNLLCSAAAHLDPIRALKGALHETTGMLLQFDEMLDAQRETYRQMLRDPTLVTHMGDHSMLYGLPEAEDRLQFLLDADRPLQTLEEAFSWPHRHLDLTDDLQDLLQVFKRLKLDVTVVNQTSPEIARNGLHCVKVIIPGMLPMTFGYHLTRLEHLDRVLTVPMELGYTSKPLTKAALNPYPHPFP